MPGGSSISKARMKRNKSKVETKETETVKSTKSIQKDKSRSRTSKKKKRNKGTASQSKDGKSEKEKVKKTQNSKEDVEKEKRSDSKSLLNNIGVKSDQPPQSREGTIGSLLDPVPKGEVGKKKLELLLADLAPLPKQETLSNLCLQKVASIETGAVLDLKCENFFHFFLQEHEVWEKVRNPGEFLVRQLPMSEKEKDNDQEEYVICVMAKDKPLNIPINFSAARNFCYINGLSFDTPAGLVQYHYRNHLALDEKGTRLLTPIMKDSMFINHAQIAFTNKTVIGSKASIAEIRTGFFSSVSVAVTDYSHYKYEQGRLEDLYQIIRLATSCNHENILKFYGIAMSMDPAYILTEHCTQGTLGSIVRRPGGPDVGKRENYAYGLAKGLEYLEHRFIIHRNIIIDNIYVDGKNQVKIGEFANATFGAKLKDKLAYVSPRHLAPECTPDTERKKGQRANDTAFSVKSDIWAFGVVLWEIFHNGAQPYDGTDEANVLAEVKNRKLRLKCLSDKFPNKLWKICEKCWEHLPDERPGITAILKDMESEQRSSSGLLDRIYESIALLME